MKKRLLYMLLAAALTLAMLTPALAADVSEELPAGEFAEEMPAFAVSSGTCGASLTWTLSDTGILTVSGSGPMTDYSSESDLPWYALRSRITSVVIEFGVSSIGANAFSGCSLLTSAVISYGVEECGSKAFYGCKALTEIELPYGLEKLGKGAFANCASLASIALPETLICFGYGVFSGCPIKTAGPTGSGCDLEYEWKDSVPSYMFSACNALTSVTFAERPDFIGTSAFEGCTSLTEVTIPKSVTYLGGRAFACCTGLISVTIPLNTLEFGSGVFSGCIGLETAGPVGSGCNIEFVRTDGIPDCMFLDCDTLKAVTFPASMRSVGSAAFSGCTALKDAYYPGTEADWNNIRIYDSNEPLTSAAFHYNYIPRPAAPANLTASNKSAGVSLTWDAVSGADSYIVCRNGVQLGTCTAASYTDKTAKSGSTYTYTVQAAAGDAHSADSDAAKIMYLSVPANVKCTNGSEGITVTWDKVEGATGYTLYRRLSTTTAWTAVFTSTKATTLSKLDTGVTDGKTYYYTVRANYKGSDGTSCYSSKATTGTKIVCSLVSALAAPTVKSIVNGFSSILVKWSKVTGAEGYYVYRKAENGSTWTKLKTVAQPTTGSTVSFGNTTPKNGETYTYKVVAYKGTTLSADSNEKTYMRLTYPTLTAVSTTAGKISFSWTDNAIATSFQIEYTTAETFTGATRKTLTGYKTSTAYSGFESGTEYHVRVRAYVKYFNKAEGKDMFYYGTWSSADETGASTQTVKVK